MPTKRSKRLVIDASIARSSGGEEATYPTSKNCRDFLKVVLNTFHQMVVTPDILEEWKRHRSDFARRWQVSMEARKRVYRVDEVIDDVLRDKIQHCSEVEKDTEAMLKDCHLIEAAIATDQLIVSLDDTACDLFAAASLRVGELRSIVWVNPDRVEEEKPIQWIEKGCASEKKRQLGFKAKSDEA